MNTHPQAAHDDAQGPLLFIGGQTNGQFRTVNRSRDAWQIPLAARVSTSPGGGGEPFEVETYVKRRFALGPSGPVVTVMVLVGLSDDLAERLLLARIAAGLAEGKW